ncbi:N-lysine methyltransferase KMT5A-like [Clinocottus analis]|uniref:N-lysine methyltransferase KMT5A-like n=1 Tax=Clinocottus analis TaxID=304258 RepID=UPI0035C1FE13
MAARRDRKLPLWDAMEHAVKALDKTAQLEVKYINSFKGRGVFAKAQFEKGDFVVEYRGDLISFEESQRRRSIYHSRCTVFMFDFYFRKRAWCVDAAREDASLGRLVNDDQYFPNCKMKKVKTNGKPHLVLFALKDIHVGEEITYDYGRTDWPWRKQVWAVEEGFKKRY